MIAKELVTVRISEGKKPESGTFSKRSIVLLSHYQTRESWQV
jgi:hypothetical protein